MLCWNAMSRILQYEYCNLIVRVIESVLRVARNIPSGHAAEIPEILIPSFRAKQAAGADEDNQIARDRVGPT